MKKQKQPKEEKPLQFPEFNEEAQDCSDIVARALDMLEAETKEDLPIIAIALPVFPVLP